MRTGNHPTPTGLPPPTGQVTGINGLCLANQNSLNTAGNPIGVTGCNGSAGQQWSPYSDGTLRTQGGCLDVVSAGTTAAPTSTGTPCPMAPPPRTGRINPTASWSTQTPGLCLADPGGNTGAQLDVETCTGSAQQQWTMPSGGGGNPSASPVPATRALPSAPRPACRFMPATRGPARRSPTVPPACRRDCRSTPRPG